MCLKLLINEDSLPFIYAAATAIAIAKANREMTVDAMLNDVGSVESPVTD